MQATKRKRILLIGNLMKNTEDIFKNADFTRGSDHKQQLYSTLFENSSQKTLSLSDDQLDRVSAAGTGIIRVTVPR